MPYLSRTFKKNIDYVNHCIAYTYEGGVFSCKPLGIIVMLHARNMSRYQTSPPFPKAIAKQVPSYLDAVSTADRRLGDCFSEWGWCGDSNIVWHWVSRRFVTCCTIPVPCVAPEGLWGGVCVRTLRGASLHYAPLL